MGTLLALLVAVVGIVVAAVSVTVPALADNEPSYSHVGSKKCKKCHIRQHKSGEETRMAKAFEILGPGNNKEAKEKFNLDVEKHYIKDEKCLKRHTVAYGKPGAYATPDLEDTKAARKTKKLAGVGCGMSRRAQAEREKQAVLFAATHMSRSPTSWKARNSLELRQLGLDCIRDVVVADALPLRKDRDVTLGKMLPSRRPIGFRRG